MSWVLVCCCLLCLLRSDIDLQASRAAVPSLARRGAPPAPDGGRMRLDRSLVTRMVAGGLSAPAASVPGT